MKKLALALVLALTLRFDGYFTVYSDNGDIMAPAESILLTFRAN